MMNNVQKIIYLLTKGGQGSGSPGGHTFRGNQWTKYDAQGNPIPGVKNRDNKASAQKTPREPKQPKVDEKLRRAQECAQKVADRIRIPAERQDTFTKNFTKLLTSPEEYRTARAASGELKSTDKSGAAILNMIEQTGKPTVLSNDEFNKIDGKTYFSGLKTTNSSTQSLDEKMATLAYGETPRYGGGLWGAAFYASPNIETPSVYASKNSIDGGVFRFKMSDPTNIYESKNGEGIVALSVLTAEHDTNSTMGGMDNPRYNIGEIMKENGYTPDEVKRMSNALFDSNDTMSATTALAGYDAMYDRSHDYLMAFNRSAMIMPDVYSYSTRGGNFRSSNSVISATGTTQAGIDAGIVDKIIPYEKALSATKKSASKTILFFTVNDTSTDNPSGELTINKGTITTQDGCAKVFVDQYLKKGMNLQEVFNLLSDDWSNGHFYTLPKDDDVLEKGDVPGHAFHGNQWITDADLIRSEHAVKDGKTHSVVFRKPDGSLDSKVLSIPPQFKPKKFASEYAIRRMGNSRVASIESVE